LDLFKIKNKIREIRSYIASDWPGIEERKRLYKQLEELEKELKAKEKEEN
jgi:hypothetical protein